MGRLSRKQVLLGLLVVGTGVAIIGIGNWRGATHVEPLKTNPAKADPDAVQEAAGATAPQVEIGRLLKRAPVAPGRDLFEARVWTAPVREPRAVMVESPPAQVPPVPFTYLGKWSERDQVVVILGTQTRTYLARVGEVLDDSWRVDSIESTYLTLTYLPLGARQTLAFGQTGAPGAGAAVQQVNADNADAVLRVAAPEHATPAEEFSIMLTLDPRPAATVENGHVDVLYDPKVLNAVAVGTRVIESGRADPGRVSVELRGRGIGQSGAAPTVRLRVVAEAATATQIRFANLAASGAEERAMAVAIDGPNPYPLAIVQPVESADRRAMNRVDGDRHSDANRR